MTEVLVGYIVPIVHVAACLFLIVVVLLQTGKGADMGAVFGGGSQTLFVPALSRGPAFRFPCCDLHGSFPLPSKRLRNLLASLRFSTRGVLNVRANG
jgi:hypothetical protein